MCIVVVPPNQSIEDTVEKLKAMVPSPDLQSRTPFYLVSSPGVDPRRTMGTETSSEGDLRRVWVDVDFLQTYFRDEAPAAVCSASLLRSLPRYFAVIIGRMLILRFLDCFPGIDEEERVGRSSETIEYLTP